MVNWWFGAWWFGAWCFGFLASPDESCGLGISHQTSKSSISHAHFRWEFWWPQEKLTNESRQKKCATYFSGGKKVT